MGDLVYYLYNKRVYPAWITSDGAAGDGSINLCYLDGVTARHSAVNKVARGIKNQQWWHDSKEALAAIEIDRRREKGII